MFIKLKLYVVSEVLRAVKMMMIFWVVTLYRLTARYQHFGETFCLHFQGLSGGAGKWWFVRTRRAAGYMGKLTNHSQGMGRKLCGPTLYRDTESGDGETETESSFQGPTPGWMQD